MTRTDVVLGTYKAHLPGPPISRPAQPNPAASPNAAA
jgi:hypothetical protein